MSERSPSDSFVERYHYVRELGRGSSGIVDLVRDEVLQIEVARKRLLHNSAESQYRLKQEFRRAREVRHENLVKLYDLHATNAETFFTMEAVAGVDPARYVAGFDSDAPSKARQILNTLRQLKDAICALHARRIVHRDVKPTNVLVEAGGRVVLLDFGLSSPLGSASLDAEQGSVVGTIAYMAPECLWGAQPSVESDWYSFGALAAELVCGASLFSGSLSDVIRLKQAPIEPLLAPANIPERLAALIVKLLAREPHERPPGQEIAGALTELLSEPGVSISHPPDADLFLGRERELELLRAQCIAPRRGGVIRVRGPAGMGKTALVQQLMLSLDTRRSSRLVLRGRCHPREHVKLKLLDSLMDDISSCLSRAASSLLERAAQLPEMQALLVVFPTLARIDQLSGASHAYDPPADPARLRADAALALRGVLQLLAADAQLLIWIDDMQWADPDGLKLLREVMLGEPRLEVTWILSYRASEDSSYSTPNALRVLSELETELAADLMLGPLPGGAAVQLAVALGAPAALANEIVERAGGSPFVLRELTQHATAQGVIKSLEEIVRERLERLTLDRLKLVQQLAVAFMPLHTAVLQELFAVERLESLLAELEQLGLVCLTYDGDNRQLVDLCHQYMREIALRDIAEAGRRQLHAQLARVLATQPNAQSSAVAQHWLESGERAQAFEWTLRAARECAEALEFEQSAQFYEKALTLAPPPASEPLLAAYADALARAGRCADAAHQFLNAAQACDDARRVSDHALQAGAQFLYAGLLGEGKDVLRGVMRKRGVAWPRAPLVTALIERTRLVLNDAPLPTTLQPASPERAERFDTLWSVAKGSAMFEHVTGDALALLALREASKLGDPSRLILTLGHEAASEANLGGAKFHWRARTLHARIASLAAHTQQPFDLAYVRMTEGIIAWFQGDWQLSEVALSDARRSCRKLQSAGAHEHNVIANFLAGALEAQGKLGELELLVRQLAATADFTGNRYTAFLARIIAASLLSLARDQPDVALREADAALAGWPVTTFTSQRLQHFVTTVWAKLYAGDVAGAWQVVEQTWVLLDRAQFVRLDAIGMLLRHLRARVALSAALDAPRRRARQLHDIATSDATRISRSSLPHAAPMHDIVASVLAFRNGRVELARAYADSAHRGLESVHMPLWKELVRFQAAALEPDPERREAERRAASLVLQTMGVRSPERLARSFMPAYSR